MYIAPKLPNKSRAHFSLQPTLGNGPNTVWPKNRAIGGTATVRHYSQPCQKLTIFQHSFTARLGEKLLNIPQHCKRVARLPHKISDTLLLAVADSHFLCHVVYLTDFILYMSLILNEKLSHCRMITQCAVSFEKQHSSTR